MSKKDLVGVSRRNFIKKSTLGVAASALIPSFMKGGIAFAADEKKSGKMKMFCYQCEQTFKGKGCTSRGICGKSPEVSSLQDLLIHTLKGVSIASHAAGQAGVRDNEADRFVCEALFSTLTNVDFDPSRFEELLDESIAHRDRMIKKAKAAGATVDMSFDAMTLKLKGTSEGLVRQGLEYGLMTDTSMGPDLLSLQHLLLFGLKGLAAYANHAAELGQEDPVVYEYVHRAMVGLTVKPEMNALLGLALECGEKNLRAMELLDAGNTGTFGHPVPTEVPLGTKKGKAILVSGHDLKDLEVVLKKSAGKGIYVYTHGEMLPCHGYPGLKEKYPHFYGHYGTAWQNQKREFEEFPGAILMTTNCIQQPRRSYKKSIFTTGTVGWPGVVHVSSRDFDKVVDKALELPGFAEDTEKGKVLVGFGRKSVLGVADKVIAGVKNKDIRHFFLVGGCDGVKKSRNYYSEFVEKVPEDCVVMTLACGKFKFFDKQLGDIGGIPRLLDIGQCNDAYSAVQIAVALSKAFGVGVNELPLSMVLSWYEQKAVAILLSLLSLGIKDIRLGPTLPAFVSPNVLQVLVDNYAIKPITTADDDLKAILG